VRTILVLALGAFGSMPVPTHATTGDSISECWTSKSAAEIHQCANRELLTAESALEAAYNDAQSLTTDRSADERDALKQAQEAWTTFRKHECDFEGSRYRGNPLQPMVYLSCWKKLTGLRTQALRSWIDEQARHP
jgi:uncharacterized protein YecT (DUF1311 family)